MPTPKNRLERLEEILALLEENKGNAKLGWLYGKLALKYGVTKRTFLDYLEALKAAGKIEYPSMWIIAGENEVEVKLIK